ncbi:MAG: LPS-assembly protein LptD [Gammaproteobacteria bacterium]|nr:LPS-assembly protein LptD [Gammaproteobacteria bacterium]
MSHRDYLLAVAIAAAAYMPYHTVAAADWSLCVDQEVVPPRPPWEGDAGLLDAGALELFADEAVLERDGISTLRGDVRVLRDGDRLHGGLVVYDRDADAMDIGDTVRYWSSDLYLSGSRAHYEFGTGEAWLDDVTFRLGQEHARGTADTVRLSTADVLLMERMTYTTCSPGAVDWEIGAASVEIDRDADVGVARHAKLEFKGVPILYTPYLSFPLSDTRKSGFLAPTIGQSTETGLDVTIPYYWNIAPERDATLALRHMSDRGTLFQGEYRYLVDDGHDGEGLLNLEYLPDDDEFGADRSLIALEHRQRLNPYWRTRVDFTNLSDGEYLNDLGTDLAVSSTRFLRRHAELGYARYGWNVIGRVEHFQILDDSIRQASRPYRRLPQLRATYSKLFDDRRLRFDFTGEAVNFDQDDRVEGGRYHLAPTLSYQYRTPGTFLVPKLTLNYTAYDLSNRQAGEPASPDRTVPVASVDSGLVFDRPFTWGGSGFIHTLEPRLFYLYAPERNQDDLPLFDTGEFSFNFAQLFRENRFSGVDRINDANQATVALTSRVIGHDGGERLRASVGRIYFFSDREVTRRPNDPPLTADSSDVVAELAADFARRWRLRGGIQWDEENDWVEKGTTQLRYQPNEEAVVNLAYRFVRDSRDERDRRFKDRTIEQTDVSARWPIGVSTALVGRWNYEITNDRTLDSFVGVEYENCCWGIRAVARRFLKDGDIVGAGTDTDYSTGFFVQLQLKGLAGIGSEAASFLEKQIPGYQNTF